MGMPRYTHGGGDVASLTNGRRDQAAGGTEELAAEGLRSVSGDRRYTSRPGHSRLAVIAIDVSAAMLMVSRNAFWG